MKKIIRYIIAFYYRVGARLKKYNIPLLKDYEYDYYYKKKMSETKVFRFLKNNPRKAFSSKYITNKLDLSYVQRKLNQLHKRKMINKTIVRINPRTIRKFNIKLKTKQPKKNTIVNFWHQRPLMEVEQFVY